MNVLEDIFGGNSIGQADFLAGAARQRHTGRRMDAQVDAMLRCRHGENYQPPDDEMGDVILNNVVTDSKTLERLVQRAQQDQPTTHHHHHNGSWRWWHCLLFISLLLLCALLGALVAWLIMNGMPAPSEPPPPSFEFIEAAA